MTRSRPHLSKSRYTSGLQCPKQLWLLVHAKALATPTPTAQHAIFDLGHRIGRLAQGLFPGGVLLPDPARRHREALAETRALLSRPEVPAIFEAVFEHGGVRVHVDVLERLDDGRFGLREVKASTRVKDEHLPDVAVQHWVLAGSGVPLAAAELIHVNGAYVANETTIDPKAFFRRIDVQEAIADEVTAVPARVTSMHTLLARREAPGIEPGAHCSQPHACAFWAHCTRGKPEDWAFHLPRLPAGRLDRLLEAGIERMGEIPDVPPLSALQARIRDAHRDDRTYVSPGLAGAIAVLEREVLYLDFETVSPAEPLVAGTHPFEKLPFQWSLHRRRSGAALQHDEFLAESVSDPRRDFAERLLVATDGGAAPVVVWSGFERTVLKELAHTLPDLAPRLGTLTRRLVDLLPVVRQHVYHPGFLGSFSIKDVAPALAPGFDWEDLTATTGLADGASAAAGFERCLRRELEPDEEFRVRAALLAYCARDTLALVRIHDALRKLAAGGA